MNGHFVFSVILVVAVLILCFLYRNENQKKS